jgi:redox-sensitive bicupin YhaK (pirin superfamily)
MRLALCCQPVAGSPPWLHDPGVLSLVIPRRARELGGFTVGRVLPYLRRRMVGPFIFFDHMGPLELARGIPRSVDVRPHPHIGLSTVTYLFEGEIVHRDSLGSTQAIRPHEINWMTAGSGITHSERFERARREGDRVHGVQVWVALPDDQEETEPTFSHHAGADLPSFEDGRVRGHVLAGSAFGLSARVPVCSPLFYLHLTLPTGTSIGLPPEYSERAIYVVSGSVEVDGQTYPAGQLLVFARGDTPTVRAALTAELVALGGEPVGERFIEWNFVASSRERIEDAKADWRAGRMKLPTGDGDEFIPLPEDAKAPANPMS